MLFSCILKVYFGIVQYIMNQSKPEAESNNKYIARSKWELQFLNDDEQIQIDFGYDRLNIRYKTCVKCKTCHREKRII